MGKLEFGPGTIAMGDDDDGAASIANGLDGFNGARVGGRGRRIDGHDEGKSIFKRSSGGVRKVAGDLIGDIIPTGGSDGERGGEGGHAGLDKDSFELGFANFRETRNDKVIIAIFVGAEEIGSGSESVVHV